MNDHYNSLTLQQKAFAAALTDCLMTIPELITQMNRDGEIASNPHYKILIQYGIAEICALPFQVVRLKRGPRWHDYYNQEGPEITKYCLDNMVMIDAIDSFWQAA